MQEEQRFTVKSGVDEILDASKLKTSFKYSNKVAFKYPHSSHRRSVVSLEVDLGLISSYRINSLSVQLRRKFFENLFDK